MAKKNMKRAKGGAMEEEGEGKKPFNMERRKAGGKVHGKAAGHRPDKRARGGATSDMDPLTSAGKMSEPGYVSKQAPAKDGGGKGAKVRSD